MIFERNNLIYNGENARFHKFGEFHQSFDSDLVDVEILSYVDLDALRVGGAPDDRQPFKFEYDPSGKLMQEQAADALLMADCWGDARVIC